jgi:hypothetical protein
LNSSLNQKLAGAICFVICMCFAVRTVTKISPAWNWDVMGYMGLTLEWESDDPLEVHRGTYAAAQAELPTPVFQSHAAGNKVLRARYEDPAVFTEHIAFYRARVLPTFLMSLLHRSGVPLTRSVWWLALGSFAATGLLMLLWLSRWMPFWVACIASTLMLHAPPLLGSASMATVDAFGTLLICAAAYLLLERRALKSAAALFTLSILARPDSIILIGILAGVVFLLERRDAQRPSLKFYGVWLAASAAAYLSVNAHAQAYGWWPLFQISFGPKVINPSELATSPNWGYWWDAIQAKFDALPVNAEDRTKSMRSGYWGTPALVTGSAFVFVYCGFAAMALALWKRVPEPARVQRHAAFLIALLATYFLRWFLFPQLWDRFFAPLYVLVPLCLLSMAALAVERPRDLVQSE